MGTSTEQTGGLQPYSVGEEYPLTVIGTIRDGETAYYVQNLVTGERDRFIYRSCENAHEALRGLHNGRITWVNLNPGESELYSGF